ncbi:right-handed parallel beta-helix repeat-containing protein [Paenibacillus sp. IB182496]|uniref:Right-handed parallel beta-helix repeat-containing protein n=1 Tax=Paenibacillus sabuli TaxID=2772509 RepID=A0A927GTW7_9BACL|nr:GDSL-type esterase/lipase family protein [Paenibacillus sabuli]MBD2847741.1 right-handed parallel beta-helix repeat-containing protein [Paenibacillus sabuli]
MRKTLAWLLTIALLVGSLPALPASAEEAPPIERRGISNTVYKLETDETLTIGYIGGSITVGTGASNPAYSWRAKTTAWFENAYPDADIREVNAGIGGFGSIPNVFRAKAQLLSEAPDLVFIEAAVNDYGQNEKLVKDSMEGLVRQIYAANPYADIVMIYTLNKEGAEQDYDNSELMKSVAWHEAIAAHYGLPFVNVGYALYQLIDSGANGATWETMFRDDEHPSDEGYAVYAAEVQQFLSAALGVETPAAPSAYALPAALYESALEEADLVDGYELAVNGFAQEETSMGGRHPHMIVSKTANATAVVNFRGSAVGLYWLKSIDAGYVEWQIDDGPPQLLSGCDATALAGGSRGTYSMLATDLSEGEHTLVLRVVGEHVTGATDTWVRIGGVFVAERSAVPPEPVVVEEPEEEPLELLFEEDFDDEPADWTINSAITRMQRPGGESGDMSMYVPAGAAGKGMVRSLDAYAGIMTYETDIRYAGAAKQIKVPDILLDGNRQGVLTSIINNSVSVPYNNETGANVRKTVAVTENEWHRIVTELNTDTDTFSIWVDGKTLVRNVKFYNGYDAASLSHVRYSALHAEDPAFWIDNVRAYKGKARFPEAEKKIADYMLRALVVREGDGRAYATNEPVELASAPYRSDGELMLPLQDAARAFQADTAYDAVADTLYIALHGREIEVRAGETAALMDGEPVALSQAPIRADGGLVTTLADAALLLDKDYDDHGATGVAMLAERGKLPPESKRSQIAVQAMQLFEEALLPSAVVYVAPDAAPGGAGTLADPYGSLTEARDAVRVLLAAGETGNIDVVLRGGTYSLSDSFRLTGADSPGDNYKVTYRAYEGERVILDGGQQVSGWEPFRDGIYRAPLPAGANPLTLYEDKRRATIARTPDGGYARAIAADEDKKSRFRFEEGDIPPVDAPEQLAVYAWPGGPSGYINYSTARPKVTSVDYVTRTVYLDRDLIYEMGTGSRYYVYNALEFLDTPGEYYVDAAANMLYYMPYGDIASADIVIPAKSVLISVAGTAAAPARNIVLQGLELRGTDLNVSTVSIADARNIEVRGSEIYNSGHIGVHINENAKNNTVENNLIYQTGFYGVFISGKANTRSNETYGNRVLNNVIRDVGELNGNAAGIRIMNASHNRIAYNKISGSPRNGIHIFGIPDPNIMGKILDDVTVTPENVEDFKIAMFNTVEYNDVSEVVQDSQDTNAIGMWGAGRGNVVRKNKIHDNELPQLTVNPGHSFWFPLYLDENSNDQIVASNVVYDNQTTEGGVLSAGFHANASKDAKVLNNVMLDVDYKNAPINANDMNTSDRISTGLVAQRNILSGFGNGNVYNIMKWRADTVASIDYNLLNSGNGEYRIGGQAPVETYAEWREYDGRGFDANSLRANPSFVSPSKRDYRLRYDSPAYAVGFRDIELSEIGLRSDYPFADPEDAPEALYAYAAHDPFKKAWARLESGGQLQMGYTLRTEQGYAVGPATVTAVTYASDNPLAVFIDATGKATAVGPGKSVITVTAQWNGQTVSTAFEAVVDDAIAAVSFAGLKPFYEVDERFAPVLVSESVYGSQRRYENVTLTADSPNVQIDGTSVTALAPGTYTLTAVSADNPALFAEATIEVLEEMLDRVEVTIDEDVYGVGDTIAWDYTLIGSKGSELDKAQAAVTLHSDADIVHLQGSGAVAAQQGVGYLSVTATVYGRVRTGTAMVAVMPEQAAVPAGYTIHHYERAGEPATSGYAYEQANRIHIATSGYDAWGEEDSMTLLARPLAAQETVTVTATVYELNNPPAIEGTGEVAIHAAAGVMIRDEDAPDSRNVFVRYRLNGDVIMSYRNETYPATSYQRGSTPGQPVEVKLEKQGSVFTGYYKNGAGDWIKIASIVCEMEGGMLVGAGLQSGSKGNMTSAELGPISVQASDQ